jgi:cardiolipin synthase
MNDTSTIVLGSGAVLVLLNIGIRLFALVVVPRNRLPQSAMAWLLAIFFLPVIGTLVFLLIGNPKLPADRRAKQEEMNRRIAESLGTTDPADVPPERSLAAVTTLAENLTAIPMLAGNRAELLPDYGGSLAAMTAALDAALTSVHVEFYILSEDDTTRPFFDALERAVARGVDVRVLLDHWASSHCRDYKATVARLDAIGCAWHLMLPVQPFHGRYQRLDLRNHRKLMTVDGEVAFIGSQNVIDRSYNKKKNIKRGLKWQELMCRVEGPAVQAVDAVFLTDWYAESGEELPVTPPRPALPGAELACQVIPSGPGYPMENNLQIFLALLYAAREQIIITSPYFVPDESMMRGLLAATRRGVHVELFVSEIGDQGMVWHAQRSYYGALLSAGVEIYCYPAPYILHAKHISVDDETAMIGSSNMDMRSFALNSEISVLMRSREFVAQMREVEAEYRRVGTPLTREAWAAEPTFRTTVDGLARLTSSLQ